MKSGTKWYAALMIGVCALSSAVALAQTESLTEFGKTEWKASAIPLHPGEPGKVPFWNVFAKRFIYAPAFNFKPVEKAVKYRFKITSEANSKTYTFDNKVPYAALSPVWTSVPVGNFDLRVVGISKAGTEVGVAGEGRYYRAAPFNGPYLKPMMPYDRSGMIALDNIMYKDYVEYWLTHKEPDHTYQYYRYPAKIYASVVVGAVTYAKVKTSPDTVARATNLAKIVADYLIGISFPEGNYLEHFPPVYYGPRIGKSAKSHAQLNNYMIINAAESGHAFLDLYDLTKEQKYLDAAKRIAQTYVKTQQPSGSWPLYLDYITGKPTADKIAVPTAMINYFDRLRTDYKMAGLEKATQQAFNWIMNNPVKDFHWLAQYEDVPMVKTPPYMKMSREQVCDLAIYLFRNRKNIPLAEDLIRFAEDQFITWEQMEDIVVHNTITYRQPYDTIKTTPGWYSKNWLTPVVHEQYGFWMPSGRNTGLMIDTYWIAYEVTKKPVYKAKALSIANNFTRLQQLHNGDYATMFTKYPMNYWINNAIYPAKVMMALQNNLNSK